MWIHRFVQSESRSDCWSVVVVRRRSRRRTVAVMVVDGGDMVDV